MTSAARAQVGRYVGRALPDQGTVARRSSLPSHQVRTRVGNVDNPENRNEKIPVLINRRVDILEEERSRRRISESAYLLGREIQDAFEASIRSSSNWNSTGASVDGAAAKDNQIVAGLEQAQHAQIIEGRIRMAVGAVGARRLRQHLGDNLSYADIAAAEGRSGERAVRDVAQRFRQLLEDVVDHQAARGKAA